MAGENDLSVLLCNLTATLDPDVYVFAEMKMKDIPVGLSPRMIFEEPQSVTLILRQHEAVSFEIKHEFPCRMITLNVHSSLDAVGFIAHVASALASENMGVNPVSGFFHDHLFVPAGREQDALKVISALSKAARQQR